MAEGPEMSDADVAEGVFGTGRCRKLETSPVVARIAARKAPLENRGVPALRSASLPDAVPGRFQYAGSFSVSRRFVPRLFGRDSVLRSAADRGRHGDNSRSAVSVSRSSDEAAVSFRMSMSKVRVRYGLGISMRWCEVPGQTDATADGRNGIVRTGRCVGCIGRVHGPRKGQADRLRIITLPLSRSN
mgnify:CR=1 FL=1